MGLLQSIIRDSGSETDEEESERPRNPYDYENLEYPRRGNVLESSSHQWRNGNYSTQSLQTKHLTVTVPNLRQSPSLAETNVNLRVGSNAVSVEENNVHRPSERTGIDSSSGQVKISCTPERWIKHYSSGHRILLVGEGDFSFSTCLASAFGWASNMVATSLDSQAFLLKHYENALSNIVELSIRKCKVMHDIDATKMANHELLGGLKFDIIIFNFPFAGFFKNLSRDSQLRRHRRLVSLFMKNAKEMMNENGEIHITHKSNGFHKEWELESLASSHRLRLIEAVEFKHLHYPGYNTKRGFGGDDNFNCYPSKTYKFAVKS
ncbi:hypothetical protein Salat_0300900 [Sesamum alatum]|uniref:25S rRNA (uridine-N(3))-methyltransferase BMT5-like domain-containing protein n=1 Tax=Sesamum alatum TaxID=300844 RepID=A0AAE1YZP5_9LAMI|nr:hypothetical protein Salat_0300900 [Sesamum alatum]